jgi:small subunit ribosomal protein S3Ae
VALENSADSLKGRVFEISLADLNKDSNEQAWRKMKVQIEEVKGFDCYTNFYGMDITRDKLCTLVKKWHTMVEAFVQTKTSDGYLLRMFCIGFTKRTSKQVSATCYAKGSQRALIRKKMMEVMINEAQKSTFKELTKKLYAILNINYIFYSITESIGQQVLTECKKIFPLQNVIMKKVKLLKKPKFDLTKLMELYQEKPELEVKGKKEDEPKNLLAGAPKK